jgi:hypothetical protein
MVESRGVPASSKDSSKRASGSPASTCTATRKDGNACHCAALPGDPHGMCFWHSPARAGERATAQMRGGHTRQHAVGIRNAPTVYLESVEEVKGVLADVITKVRRGQLEPKAANSLGYLLMQGLKAVEMADINRRLKALEAKEDGRGKAS